MLAVGNNAITDLAPLAGLRSLTYLYLDRNGISDLAPLAQLTSLSHLSLADNAIADMGPLLRNVGLGCGDSVDLERNRLSAKSLDEHVPKLLQRGVAVAQVDGTDRFGRGSGCSAQP